MRRVEKSDVAFRAAQANLHEKLKSLAAWTIISKSGEEFAVVVNPKKAVLLAVSPNFVKHLGYLPEEMEGKNYFTFIHPEDLPKTKKVFEALRASDNISNQIVEPDHFLKIGASVPSNGAHGSNGFFTNRYRKKDGSYAFIRWDLTGIRLNGVVMHKARAV